MFAGTDPRDAASAARIGGLRVSRRDLIFEFPTVWVHGGGWSRLAEALRHHARDHEVIETGKTRHGTRYAVDGPLVAPDGTVLNIRSAWFIDAGAAIPRFVTAHPLPKL